MKMALTLTLLALAFPAFVAANIPIESIHPQCSYTGCIDVTYLEQLSTNIYKVQLGPMAVARKMAPTCERMEVDMAACSDLTGYFLDYHIQTTRPLQICNIQNNPKPASCSEPEPNDSKASKESKGSKSGEEEAAFPCCDFIYMRQFNLPTELIPNPPPLPEGMDFKNLTTTAQGYTIVFDDGWTDEIIDGKWAELKNFLADAGLPHYTNYFNLADFGYPGAPDTNRYWVMIRALV